MNLEALNVSGCSSLRSIPSNLQAQRLIARDCPELEFIGSEIKLDYACFEKCQKLTFLTQSFSVKEALYLIASPVEVLPEGLDLKTYLDIRNNGAIRSLPTNLSAKEVAISDCPNFEAVPPGTKIDRLSILYCNKFRTLPENLDCPNGLAIIRCDSFTSLPKRLTVGQRFSLNCRNVRLEDAAGINIDTLEISGCPLIKTLPEDLVVKGSIAAERSHVEGISWEVWDKNDGKIILPYTCVFPSPPSADCGPSL